MATHTPHQAGPDTKTDLVVSKLNRSPEEYIEDRVQYKINQYSRKAWYYRLAYWGMASTAAICAALVPMLVNAPGVDKIYPTIASLVVVVIVALEGVFHPREVWRNYDLISAVLREEEMRYSTRAGEYAPTGQRGDDEVFRKFVARVEDAIAKERGETVVMRTAAPELKNGAAGS